MDMTRLDRLVARMLSIHDTSPTSYDRQELERLIRWDPELFTRFRRRASKVSYLRGRTVTPSLKLWIALNLTHSVEASPWCYFCGGSYTRADVLAGNVHLEHFIARSRGGEHHPVNITLACDRCNRLKSDLRADDFNRMLTEPDKFFASRPQLLGQRQRLLAFAEISTPHYAGLSWIGERFGAPSTEWRKIWDSLRTTYRRNWH